MQTELLSLNRSSLYYQPRPPSAEEVHIKHRIDEIYTQIPYYGARKIAAQLVWWPTLSRHKNQLK